MRQLRIALPSQALIACAFSFVLLASGSFAHAKTTLDSVDESRLSAVTGLQNTTDRPPSDDDTTVTVNPIIYGGVAGDISRGTCASRSATSTCDNCALAGGETGDGRLLACNNRRVHGGLQLRLFVRSDSIDSGIPLITVVPTSGDTTQQVLNTPQTQPIAKGNLGEIAVDWSKICSFMALSNGGTGSASDCVLPTTSDQATITVRVGIDKLTNGTRDGILDSDEYTQVQFILRNGIRTSTGDVSAYTDGDMAINYFEIGSGDKKAYVMDNLVAPSGFPSANNINIRWVRALYEKRTTRTTPMWNQIKPDSPHQDLEVSGDTTTAIELSPRRITGLENDQIYDFKFAMVDAARNVGYYTSTDNNQDTDCDGDAISPESGIPECHTARPAEVVGVLSNTTNCFVATASYGSPMAKEVVTFRAFRDRVLIPNPVGRAFVKAYYKYGPYAANLIATSDTLRAGGRALLWAPLQFVKFSLAHGFLAALALLSTIIIAPPAVWVWARRIRKSRAS